MKRKQLILLLLAIAVAIPFTSCKEADECPPRNTGYQRKVILPNPQDLTPSDRLYIQELRQEYDANKNEK